MWGQPGDIDEVAGAKGGRAGQGRALVYPASGLGGWTCMRRH